MDWCKRIFHNFVTLLLRKLNVLTPMINIETLCICGETIERVTQFAYLGSIIDNTGVTGADITVRIRKTQIAFSALSKIWHSASYSTQSKVRISNTNVKAVLFYRCETWKNKNKKKINKKKPSCKSLLTFRHRASCVLGQAFHYSPENAFYIYLINKYISLSDICLTVHH